jgi:hypothetical protein
MNGGGTLSGGPSFCRNAVNVRLYECSHCTHAPCRRNGPGASFDALENMELGYRKSPSEHYKKTPQSPLDEFITVTMQRCNVRCHHETKAEWLTTARLPSTIELPVRINYLESMEIIGHK